MKKAIYLWLTVCLALSLFSCASADTPEVIPETEQIFTDVAGTEYEEDILYLIGKGLLAETPDGLFRPGESVTRAEAAELIAGVLRLERIGEPEYTDVSKDDPAYDAIAICTMRGIINASKGAFDPDRPLTRQEAFVVLCRASGLSSDAPEPTLKAVSDSEEIKSWARESVAALIEASIIKPDGSGKVYPLEKMTRGEFASLLAAIDRTTEWSAPPAQLDPFYMSWRGTRGAEVKPQLVAGEYWLFLPSSANKESLELSFAAGFPESEVVFSGDLGESASMPLNVTMLSTPGKRGEYTLCVSSPEITGEDAITLHILFSEGLSSVFLNSDNAAEHGRSFVELGKENAVSGTMTMLSASGEIIYSGELPQFRLRGNSTTYYPKKSYQIKLASRTDLLRIGQKSKTWTLLAQYADAALFRDKLCKDMAADLGLYGTPDSGWVDLYYDGAYRGVYELSEKVKIDPNGLYIRDLEKEYEAVNEDYGSSPVLASGINLYGEVIHYAENIVDPVDITSGFLLEENHYSGDESCWFKTNRGRAVNVKSPEYISKEAAEYISGLFQEFEDAAYAQDKSGQYTGVNPKTGKDYTEYADLDSLARLYLIYFFSNNQDAYCQSTFYYLVNGKLYAGPIWDSDQSFGIGWTEQVLPSDELRFDHIAGGLVNVKSFRQAVKEIYVDEFRAIASEYAERRIYEYFSLLSGAERMNHVIWPEYFSVSGVKSSFPEGSEYSDAVKYVGDWMLERLSYMDAKLADW